MPGRTVGRNIFLIAAMTKDVREEIRKADEAAIMAEKYGKLDELEELDARGIVSLAEIAEQLEPKEPTPEEIKHQLKYEKNQMKIKQLNRQLTQAYKKRKKEIEIMKGRLNSYVYQKSEQDNDHQYE